jgi:hypothetical protein
MAQGQANRRVVALVEGLEQRKLLAADLAVSIASTTLPNSLILGAATKPFVVQAAVSNVGDALVKNAAGTVGISVGLRDSLGTVTSIGTATVDAKRLAPNKAFRSSVKVTLPTSLAEGAYTLVAIATPTGGPLAEETNTSNNTAAGKAISVSPANADIAVAATSTLTGTVATGSSGTAKAVITNNGNVDAKTKGTLELIATTNGVSTAIATVANVSINIKPGKTFSSKPVKFSVSGTGTSNTSVTLGARFTPATALAGDNTADNSVTIGTLTVTPPPPSPFTSVNSSVNLAGTITFKKTQRVGARGFFSETGTFTDSAGRTGTYTMAIVPTGTARRGIVLNNSAGTPFMTGNFSDSITGVGGKTFTFSLTDPGNSIGTFAALGTTYFVRNGK